VAAATPARGEGPACRETANRIGRIQHRGYDWSGGFACLRSRRAGGELGDFTARTKAMTRRIGAGRRQNASAATNTSSKTKTASAPSTIHNAQAVSASSGASSLRRCRPSPSSCSGGFPAGAHHLHREVGRASRKSRWRSAASGRRAVGVGRALRRSGLSPCAHRLRGSRRAAGRAQARGEGNSEGPSRLDGGDRPGETVPRRGWPVVSRKVTDLLDPLEHRDVAGPPAARVPKAAPTVWP